MEIAPYAIVGDLAIIMAVAAVVTFSCYRLNQPLILGYLIAGMLIGPYGPFFSLVTRLDVLSELADMGMILLLFGIGLHFPLHELGKIRLRVYVIISVIEIALMFLISFVIVWILGWPLMDGLFLGAALASSSSVMITKVLGDLGKLEDLSSMLMIGVLIVEDVIVVIMLAFITPIVGEADATSLQLAWTVVRALLFVVGTLFAGGMIIPRIIDVVARPNLSEPNNTDGRGELLILLALGLCFGWSILSHHIGLSAAIGAFLMGTIVAGARSAEKVSWLISPIRDMFGAVFFVSMGALIDVGEFRIFLVPALMVTVVMVVGKVLGCGLGTRLVGYEWATALKVGLGMGQIGEFAFIATRVGQDLDVISASLFPTVGVAVAITAFLTPYMIRLGYRLTGNRRTF
jgi:monovalent cation:H+ antiporter-2, CPA2 family